MKRHFQLIPHLIYQNEINCLLSSRGISDIPSVQLQGVVQRKNFLLTFDFLLKGGLEEILIPPWKTHPACTDFLWKYTCFEAFWSWKNFKGYWELNISPSGDWKIYCFDAYREGQKDEWRLSPPQIIRQMTSKKLLKMTVTLDLQPLSAIGNSDVIELGISCVLKDSKGTMTFWSLKHPNPKPDFHAREGFTLSLSR